MVRVRALYDDTEIAFHVTWNDPTQSVKHTTLPGAVTPIDDTFVPAKTLWKRRALKLRDSLQLQFPSRMKKGGAKPFFFLGGGGGGGVNLWRWLADTGAFEDRVQGRATAAATARPKAQQLLSGKAAYDDGRWSLVVRRPRLTEHKKQVQFGAEAVVPFAVQAWDGGNGEEALLCSISSWYYLRLETPIPLSAWLAGGGGLLFALLLGRLLVFLACRVREPEDTPTTSEPEGSAS